MSKTACCEAGTSPTKTEGVAIEMANPAARMETNADLISTPNLESTPRVPLAAKAGSCSMDPGSVSSAAISLAVSAVGAGLLSLPYLCKLCGLIPGLILLVIGYFLSLWSFNLIIRSDQKSGGHKSFKDYCMSMGGPKVMLVFNLSLLFTIYGAMFGYQVIIAALIQGVLKAAGVENYEDYKIYHILAVSILITFPLCILGDISSLRYGSMLCLMSISYTVIVLIIELPYYWINGKISMDDMTFFKFDWSFLKACGMTFCSYASQNNFYAATEKMNNRSSVQLKKATYYSAAIDLVIYLSVTTAGYMGTLDYTPDLITNRDPPYKGTGPSIPMTIAQIACAISLCITTPLNNVCARTAAFEQLFPDPSYTFTR